MVQKIKTVATGNSGKPLPRASASWALVVVIGFLVCWTAQAGEKTSPSIGEKIGKNSICRNHMADEATQSSRLSRQGATAGKGVAKDVIDNLLPASGTAGGHRIFSSKCEVPSEDHFKTGPSAALLSSFASRLCDVTAHSLLGRTGAIGSIPLCLTRVLLL